LHRLERVALETTLGAWAEGLLGETPASPGTLEGIALDGKTLRGSKKPGAPAAHLLSALAHRGGVTLGPEAVGEKTNEIPVALELLRQVVLTGRVVTMDALLTHRQMAAQIVEAGGDYVMLGTGNQPHGHEDITTVFAHAPIAGETRPPVAVVDYGHGRIEQRRLQTSTVLAGYSEWPGLAPVFQVEREVIMAKTGVVRDEVVAGVTSLGPERAEAAQLLALVREHWHIEPQSHWGRDVTCEEDRSQVRRGSIPQVMAALRNTVIGLRRWAGHTHIAATCRRFAAQPASALALIGIKPDN
jgi:predicted transposase YbfD/YdcC